MYRWQWRILSLNDDARSLHVASYWFNVDGTLPYRDRLYYFFQVLIPAITSIIFDVTSKEEVSLFTYKVSLTVNKNLVRSSCNVDFSPSLNVLQF
jgi:hypothetical protein